MNRQLGERMACHLSIQSWLDPVPGSSTVVAGSRTNNTVRSRGFRDPVQTITFSPAVTSIPGVVVPRAKNRSRGKPWKLLIPGTTVVPQLQWLMQWLRTPISQKYNGWAAPAVRITMVEQPRQSEIQWLSSPASRKYNGWEAPPIIQNNNGWAALSVRNTTVEKLRRSEIQ